MFPFCTQNPCSLRGEFLKAQRMQDQVEVRHGHTGCVFRTWYIIPLVISHNSWLTEYTLFRERSVAGLCRWDIAQMCIRDIQHAALCYLFSEHLYVIVLPIHNSDVSESHFPELPCWYIGSFQLCRSLQWQRAEVIRNDLVCSVGCICLNFTS